MDLGPLLESSGAILRGHFLLTSGRHSDVYVEKFRILEQPEVLGECVAEIAAAFGDASIDVVVGPTTGGIIIAFETARQMGKTALYVESENGTKKLRRGAQLQAGARVLVVDDVITTGLSVHEVVDLVRSLGGEVAGVAVLVDRSQAELEFGCRLFASYRVEATSYAPDDVPEWLQQIPIIKPGTRVSDNRVNA